jgi:hypothetical protein
MKLHLNKELTIPKIPESYHEMSRLIFVSIWDDTTFEIAVRSL